MKIPASPIGERMHRIECGDLWEPTREVCRTCLKATPDGVDQCDACREFEFETPTANDGIVSRFLKRLPEWARIDASKAIKHAQAEAYAAGMAERDLYVGTPERTL